MNRILMIIVAILVIPFVVGLFVDIGRNESIWFTLYGFYAILIILGLGIYAIVYFVKKNGFKGVLIGIFIFLVLIPLAFLGTCILAASGGLIRKLFFK